MMVSRRSPLPDNEIWEIGSKKRMKQSKLVVMTGRSQIAFTDFQFDPTVSTFPTCGHRHSTCSYCQLSCTQSLCLNPVDHPLSALVSVVIAFDLRGQILFDSTLPSNTFSPSLPSLAQHRLRLDLPLSDQQDLARPLGTRSFHP